MIYQVINTLMFMGASYVQTGFPLAFQITLSLKLSVKFLHSMPIFLQFIWDFLPPLFIFNICFGVYFSINMRTVSCLILILIQGATPLAAFYLWEYVGTAPSSQVCLFHSWAIVAIFSSQNNHNSLYNREIAPIKVHLSLTVNSLFISYVSRGSGEEYTCPDQWTYNILYQ